MGCRSLGAFLPRTNEIITASTKLASSQPPIQAFEGRVQRESTFRQKTLDSRFRPNDDINDPSVTHFVMLNRSVSMHLPAVVDVDINPIREEDGVLAIANHRRLDQHVPDPGIVKLHHAVYFHHPPKLSIELVALG
jgi:hypothetical protein